MRTATALLPSPSDRRRAAGPRRARPHERRRERDARRLRAAALRTAGHTNAEHEAATRLLLRHGADSIAPFALHADKALFLEDDGFVAYRVLGRCAIVSGDPVGAPGRAPELLAAFRRTAARRGWSVVLDAADGAHLEAYRAAGMRATCIGREAMVDPAGFTLEGRAVKSVRKARSRLDRAGWTLEVVHGASLGAGTREALARIDAAWCAARPRTTGFAMVLGRLGGADADDLSVWVLARDPDGELRGFLRFAEHLRGLSLDVMRRPDDAPNGACEAMVAEALLHARDRGLAEVSLSFAGFGHLLADDAPDTRRARAARWGLRRAHERFQMERLASFNERFGPTWRRRYVVRPRSMPLALAGLRVLRAEGYVGRGPAAPPAGGWRPAPFAPGAAAGLTPPEPLPRTGEAGARGPRR